MLIRLGVAEPGEDLDADSLKTKLVFALCQMLYTLITIIPTPFLYSSYRLSCAYLVVIFGWGTWNGASYYIEVFAERYRLQFIKMEDSDKDDASITTVESDDDEDSDMYEMALEDVEIDQSSELYQTIVAAIIEESDNKEKSKNVFKSDHEDLKESENKESKESSDSSNGNGWEDLGSQNNQI